MIVRQHGLGDISPEARARLEAGGVSIDCQTSCSPSAFGGEFCQDVCSVGGGDYQYSAGLISRGSGVDILLTEIGRTDLAYGGAFQEPAPVAVTQYVSTQPTTGAAPSPSTPPPVQAPPEAPASVTRPGPEVPRPLGLPPPPRREWFAALGDWLTGPVIGPIPGWGVVAGVALGGMALAGRRAGGPGGGPGGGR